MKRLFILSILLVMIVYHECSDCTNGAASSTSGTGTGTGTGAGEGTGTGTGAGTETKPEEGSRRRLVDESTCSKLKTSDDSKKKCVYNKDKNKCEEVAKDSSSMIKIPIFLLISLLFI